MIWIVGGTSDADYLSNKLKNFDHLLTLGTREGQDYYNKENYIYRPMDQGQMEDFIKENNIDLVIDMTHPFAIRVSKNARAASENQNIPYVRYERENITYPDQAIIFDSYDQALDYLSTYQGTLFVTTGVNMAHKFEDIKGNNRFIYRVLPMVESVEKLHQLGINIKDIIAMVGPFSKGLNKQIIKDYNITGLIMKDSGEKGGSLEKIQGALEASIDLFIIKRQDQSQSLSLEDFTKEILEKLKNNYKFYN